jgi:integrase
MSVTELDSDARKDGSWQDEQKLVNNLNRRLATLRKRAGVAKFTYHDLRRSCITNWARHLPIHVVQKLAGHSDIKTTQAYYLPVQHDDLEKARRVQSKILRGGATDPKLTHSVQKRAFSQEKQNEPST